jgi:hypothetical protein
MGVDQRSGTNFLFNLLAQHPSCHGNGPIWEDHVIQYSGILQHYVEALYGHWNPSWEVKKKLGGPKLLFNYLGSAVEEFLKLQLNENTTQSILSSNSSPECEMSKILLTKTPNVEGVDKFFDLFPNALLILLVRDGRAVVESGVKSFDWDYEEASKRWCNRAQAILDFKDRNEGSNQNFMVIKYEDLVLNQKDSLSEIFDFLGLDSNSYKYEKAESLGVIGSSECRKEEGSVHWKEMEKSDDFDPLARFSNWSIGKHARFNWIAGEQMKRLGYELSHVEDRKRLCRLQNQLVDTKISLTKIVRNKWYVLVVKPYCELIKKTLLCMLRSLRRLFDK